VADEVVLAPLYAAEKVPEGERLDVERLAADLRREDVPARLIPTVDATVEHLATRASPGDTVLVMTSGDYGGLHDKLLRKLGDPVMPARLEHKARIGNLLDRVGIAHPVLEQFWPYYLVIPGDDDAAPLVGCVAIEMVGDVALLRMLAVAPSAAARGSGTCWSKRRPSARAPRACAISIWSPTARRAISARSWASRRSIARTWSRRSRRPRSTRWRDRRPRPGCARSCRRGIGSAGAGARDRGRHRARGGADLAGRVGDAPGGRFKGEDINLVTEYDKRSEALIVERLAAAFPEDRVVAEEGTTRGEAGGAQRVWYVDPLDGTTNFAHGMPLFSVSLGLAIDRRPVLGVVEAPALGGRSRARARAVARRSTAVQLSRRRSTSWGAGCW